VSNAMLGELVKGLAAGDIKLVDLTETLRPDYPTITLPEEFGQAWGFKMEQFLHERTHRHASGCSRALGDR